VPWRPPLAEPGRPAPTPGVAEALADHAVLVRAPHDIDLRPGHTLGIVGDRPAVESLLRSLVIQAATLHGPADVRIAVLTEPDRAAAWSWAKWLPHTQAAGEAAGVRLLATDDAERSTVLAALVAMAPPPARGSEGHDAAQRGPARVVVADADGLTEGRPSPVRALLGGAAGPVAGIVVASDVHRLPARCTTVLELDADGVLSTFEPATNQRVEHILVGGLTIEAAAEAARSLAGVEDPEVREVGASLPDRVSLLSLLGIEPTAADVLARWREAGEAPALRAPIGVTEDGPLVVDLVTDGPHGLLGGTTGSGKSELLRTLVAGLAASTDPDHLTFVLVDYKGGSAFDACARLPHTVGLVTDLDEHLGERALRCLEAELRHRESVLRTAGARDLPHYLTLGRSEPLPRLLVVIDEFATLATELPDFIDALVGVAQRGRSLGVHLVLATQRPAGVVKDNIRANTDLRIALRMQDGADSADVIDSRAAAAIGRRQAGRGYVRRGPGDTVPFQAAIVSTAGDAESSTAVAARPFRFGPEPVAAPAGPGRDDTTTDLDRLVDAIRHAAVAAGIAPPRRPWPDPLPAAITLDEADPRPVPATPGDAPHAVLGLADDPARQRRALL
jgi:S-DNA-T family DNA segregation ATPase FtsK/SpoIIIE